ncbi:MAG: SGNH/GDSL hydrolase family protein, partial [Snowella sp.]
MTIGSFFLWCSLGGLFLPNSIFLNQDSKPIQIALIGDSITQGRRGNPEQNLPPTISWRYPFWQKLVDQNINVNLVGSNQSGFEGDPPWPNYKEKIFDRDHEARWGASTEEILAQLSTGLTRYTPDLALILLGTNDVQIDQALG